MQMFKKPGSGYNENHYKVEKEDYVFKSDDFLFNKNPAAPTKHDHRVPPPMPYHNNYGNYKPGYEGYNNGKHGGNNYSETIYEQEEMQYHVNRNDQYSGYHGGHNKHFNGHDRHGNTGRFVEQERYYYSDQGPKKAPAVWDCKGIDD